MPVVSACSLSKRYRLGTRAHDTLRDQIVALFRCGKRSEVAQEFWALRDVSFEVEQGQVLAVIGRNGAGKSTLLKILSQITEPTAGEVRIRGRIASLLEVGTGFHPELTGRENVFLNGAILGMSRAEIRAKFDEIVAFAEVEKFLDTPVKHYSSGMTVRLAFGVAAHLEPEILVVDEVLAVGDIAFQKKCLGKMQDVAGHGRTVLFVSHNMGALRTLCTHGIVLDRGQLQMAGTAHAAVEHYLGNMAESTARRARFPDEPSQAIAILEVAVLTPGKSVNEPFDTADALEVEIRYRVRSDLRQSNVAIHLLRESILIFKSFDTDLDQEIFQYRPAGDYVARIALPRRLFVAGRYFLEVTAGRPSIGFITRQASTVSFELEELGEDVTHKSYAARRGGLLILPLRWEQHPIPLGGAAPDSLTLSTTP